MKGRFLHNRVLIEPLAEYFRLRGVSVLPEYPIRPGRSAPAVDLYVPAYRLVIEAELTADRVLNDRAKALAMQADMLLIVTPTRRVTDAANRRLKKAGRTEKTIVEWILPVGPALQRIRDCFPILSDSIHRHIDGKTTQTDHIDSVHDGLGGGP